MRTLREPRPERVDDPDQRELPLVLIVEDDPAVRRALEKILAPHYAIRIAPDGQAGVGAALSLRPDVVIADLGLRDVNGLHVCEAIKASLRTTPVLIVTASRERATRTECLSSGADDC
jgi:DNA-binding response OmpR family regulator